MRKSLLITLLLLSIPMRAEELPTIADKTKSMRSHKGFFTFYWDDEQGKIWLQIERLGDEFLYVTGLATGLGSNPVGLDRGQLGAEKLVYFEKVGPKLLLVQPNQRYRASSNNPRERQAVTESFAQSILWGAEIAARTGSRYLVDATSLIIRDAHQVARTLERTKQGSYSLDDNRSAVYLPRCNAFPDNTELEVTLTFSGQKPGSLVRGTTPTPEAVTLRQHHSFIRLPDDGYKPRVFDPRAGYWAVTWADYAAPLDAPLETRVINRHRLIKRKTGPGPSPVIEPLVYYVDPGAPEPIRSALMDGARWWTQAFEAIGFQNAFRVELLPPGADPMDVRYNVIQWVHRATRGWSYGSAVTDPRTGEIIKGHVSLGSLRVRQDRLLMEGLEPRFDTASCGLEIASEMSYLADLDPATSAVDLALARIRQLAAHEVGHTLGLAHNFIASTYGGRASVMDYPAPMVKVTGANELDLSQAYAVGAGAWDLHAIRYGYSEFDEGADETAALEAIVNEGLANDLAFISDNDARPAGAAHPYASLWDNGSDPVEALNAIMEVRRIALLKFGEQNLPEGLPQALLQNTLVPLYLHHRYQLAATAKMLGGVRYTYKLRGDGQMTRQIIAPKLQESALKALLATLSPVALALSPALIDAIPPMPIGYNDRREQFNGRSSVIFDPLAAAEVAAGMTIRHILQSERAVRLEAQHHQDRKYPGFEDILKALIRETWGGPRPRNATLAAVDRVVENVVVDELLALAANGDAAPEIRAITELKLGQLAEKIGLTGGLSTATRAHRKRNKARIERYLSRKYEVEDIQERLPAPPGSPIGGQ